MHTTSPVQQQPQLNRGKQRYQAVVRSPSRAVFRGLVRSCAVECDVSAEMIDEDGDAATLSHFQTVDLYTFNRMLCAEIERVTEFNRRKASSADRM